MRVSRLTETRLAQFFFDITAHKIEETRQSELLAEINHRVKNNLAMVASLLQLQARGARDDVRGELSKAASRVQTIADIHVALTQEAGADEVEFGAYLQDLCAGLRRSLAIQPGVTLTVETEAANLSVEAAAPLGMVVNELVTNAAKYAHAPDATGTIDVRFGREDEHLLLTVRDDGRGLPDPSLSREGALGMRLVRSLVASVGGELAIRGDEGACFEIRLKNGGGDRVA